VLSEVELRQPIATCQTAESQFTNQETKAEYKAKKAAANAKRKRKPRRRKPTQKRHLHKNKG